VAPVLVSDRLFVRLQVTEDGTRSMAARGFYFLPIAGLTERWNDPRYRGF